MLIKIPHYSFKDFYILIVTFILTLLIILPIGLFKVTSIISFIILFVLIYIIIKTMSSENLSTDLSPALYPSMPHTGLDGISLYNYAAGVKTDNYII
jgi:hypothetical protein